jgi:uncharacterized protein with von Willebrand factor type A (vWA) domain
VLEAVNKLPDMCGGGTTITQAVKTAISLIKQRPSRVQANQIILVTDGQDHEAVAVEDLLSQMKELNIVFDFIFIRGQTEDKGYYTRAVDVLRKVCSETGGEYQTCSKASDFEMQLMAASNRPALPPARDEKGIAI